MEKNKEKIVTWDGHFQITFENGYMVSAFNGRGSYSTTLRNDIGSEYQQSSSKNTEIAIFAPDGSWATRAFLGESLGDDVKGDVSTSEFVDILLMVSKHKRWENGQAGDEK